jgi:hypothetical protein
MLERSRKSKSTRSAPRSSKPLKSLSSAMTRQPASMKRFAVARPIPRAAPVTRTLFS